MAGNSSSRKSGQPTKLTPAVQESIVNYLRKGNTIEVSARCSGINPQTFYNWMRWGEEAGSGDYFEFFGAVKKAQAEAEEEYLATIRAASLGWETRNVKTITKPDGSTETTVTEGSERSWQAAAWVLERTRAAQYQKQTMDVVAAVMVLVRDGLLEQEQANQILRGVDLLKAQIKESLKAKTTED